MVKFSKKSVIIVIVAAVLSLSVVAGGVAYAVWDDTAKTIGDFKVDVSGNTVLELTQAPVTSQLKLLPESAQIVDNAKETKKLKIAEFTTSIKGEGNYQIKWEYTSCAMKDDAAKTDYRNLFDILIYVGTDDNGTALVKDTLTDTVSTDVTYSAYIVMKDPDTNGFSKDAVIGKSFLFSITLSIELKPEPTV